MISNQHRTNWGKDSAAYWTVKCLGTLTLSCIVSAQLAWGQFTTPLIPEARPNSDRIIRTISSVAPLITGTATPNPGDLLFSFNFENADVLDLRRQLIAASPDQVEGVLLPKQLLIDPHTFNAVVVHLLDKITTELETRTIALKDKIEFGTLTLTVDACLKNPQTRTPESGAYLTILDQLGNKEEIERFKGWMFSSSPALNALDHAIYDVWVIDCINVEMPNTAQNTSDSL